MPQLSRFSSNNVTLLGRKARPGGVAFAFTERTGGVSVGPYSSLNLGSRAGDDSACVAENRRRAFAALGFSGDLARLVCPKQVHGVETCVVSDNTPEALSRAQAAAEAGCDAIVCTAADVPVLLCYADCVPVVLVCDAGFAVIHSGWRGTIARISAAALDALVDATGVSPADISCYIGPHITGEDYEVSGDLLSEFVAEFGSSVCAGERHLDLAAAIRTTLTTCGVPNTHILNCGISTASNTDRFFSYRAQSGVCGRHGALAYLSSASSAGD